MTTTATVIRVLVGIAGVIMLALGVAFWTGNALTLIPIHMLIGLGIALSLWVLALLALLRRWRPGLAVVALLWGLLMPALGLAQGGLLPGSAHWIFQSLHLLVGLSGIALAQALGSAVALSQPSGSRDGVVETETLRSRFAHPAASTFGLAAGQARLQRRRPRAGGRSQARRRPDHEGGGRPAAGCGPGVIVVGMSSKHFKVGASSAGDPLRRLPPGSPLLVEHPWAEPPGGRDGVVETETLRSRFAHPAASTFGLAVGASSGSSGSSPSAGSSM